MLREQILTGIAKSLRLTLFLLIATSVNATIFSTGDGWDEMDDVYASGSDGITFSDGDILDSRYEFQVSAGADTFCIATPGHSQSVVVDGDTLRNVHQYEYVDLGADRYFQAIGGDDDTCRFYYWDGKDCTDGDDVWLTSIAEYTAQGCAPDVSGILDEGDVDTYPIGAGSVEVSCIFAYSNELLKCQAETFADLDDCMDDSQSDVNGGDDFDLYEACVGNSDSGTDTNSDCDVRDVGDFELSFLDNGHLSADDDLKWASGFPNTTFTIYSYGLCNTGLFDRDTEGTVDLTQFQTKGSVCTEDGFDVVGYVTGYYPWYGHGGVNISANYTYGDSECDNGNVCFSSVPTTDNNEDLDLLACIDDGGSCYDGRINQDEILADYGGICGSCDNTTAANDVSWSVAYQSQPSGYFDTHEFNSTVQCPEAEESIGFSVIFMAVIEIFIVTLLVVFLGGIAVFFMSVGVTSLLLGGRSFLKRKQVKRDKIK